MFTRKSDGFTVIELLTVIAIIAILAAIIFPVMAGARRKAKETECITNLNQIYTAIKQFQLDEHRYPDFIAGPALLDSNGNVIPLDKSTGMRTVGGTSAASLYPEYIKSISGLKCPMSVMSGDNAEYTLTDTIPDPMYNFNSAMLRADPNGEQYKLYKYSSYDYQVPPGSTVSEVHYSPAWMEGLNDPNVERQLKWRNPPEDTVITWCSFHRDVNASGNPSTGSKDLVLFLDGRVKRLPSTEMVDWMNAWKNANPGT
jgi:prepilin-type N-terminal cleavage/methylation domain-containing protein